MAAEGRHDRSAMRRFGKYLLLDKISTGGMADVYRAKLVGIRGFTKTIAIKRIHPHLLERKRFLRMFTDEAKIASRLVHPNIVQIYDLGEEEGIPYIAMEYVPGRDLFRVVQKLVSQRNRCPWRLATRVISETAAALYYAHEFRSLDGEPQEIVHRDVSPRNILISYSGEVKLTDFGIARARDREEHTELGVIKGKVRYISPEGAGGGRVDGRSDLYSLGVVFTEMMTMAPFREAPNDMAMLLDIRRGKFDRTHINRLPEPIRVVIERSLAVDPADRFPDANAFREELLRSVDEDTRPMSDIELKRFMESLYADDIAAEQETERRAEELSHDQDWEGLHEPRPAGEPRAAATESANPLALNLPGVPRVRVPARSHDIRKPDLEGDLLHMPVPRLLQRLRNARETGQLDLARDPVRKTVFLEHGEPSFAVSNVEREFFGEYLVARGALTREQHTAVLDRAAKQGLRFMEAALAMQVVSPEPDVPLPRRPDPRPDPRGVRLDRRNLRILPGRASAGARHASEPAHLHPDSRGRAGSGTAGDDSPRARGQLAPSPGPRRPRSAVRSPAVGPPATADPRHRDGAAHRGGPDPAREGRGADSPPALHAAADRAHPVRAGVARPSKRR